MKSFCKISPTIIVLTILWCLPSLAQPQIEITDRVNTVNTAVPFLRINPDARSGAMGDAGIATSPDAYANFHNPSKLAFTKKQVGMSDSYTPWISSLVNDIYLLSHAGYYRIDEVQAIGVSMRYFSLGKIQFTDRNGENIGESDPNEFAIDASYARKLTDNFSTGITLRFIYSNLAADQQVSGVSVKPATAASGDISFFYNKEFTKIVNFSAGLNISNLGNKITYTESAVKDFLPANLGVGTNFQFDFNEYHQLSFTFDVNKLLAPTPTEKLSDDSTTLAYRKKSVPAGVLGSFSDAPGGFQEELREFTISQGVEYWLHDLFALRAGYFWEHATKGNRKFVNVGIGFKFNVFGFDLSYIVPASNERHPLDNVYRITLNVDFDVRSSKNGSVGD